MCRLLQPFLLLVTISILFVNCRKKQWDEYYGRPEGLEPPIYQVLQSKGNFSTLLTCIDKAGYTNILGAAGYWTFFAPTDSAFQTYFKQNNISSVNDLDQEACRKIVTYCLVYNAFKKERIGDAQTISGWVANGAFKRRTANYTGVYDGANTTGKGIKVIASNRNGLTYYVDGDNNNKYIPYFTDNFIAAKALSAGDYNYFYPGINFTGFNVVDAIVTEKDIPAENGVIHVVNKVITALPSIDQYIAGKPEYSEFRKLFDKYLIQYAMNNTVTNNYRNVTGAADTVYTKVFNPSLAFALNNENFLKQQDNDGQGNTYTLFVPTNDAFNSYKNTVLLEHYNSLDEVPIGIIYDFINAHMWQTAVWPSKFNTTFNYLGEEARFDPNANVIDKRILSNGIFYGTNKVQEANVFSSVYGKAYLDPQYSMMTSLLNQELKFTISNIKQKYTIFLISNNALTAAGFTPDPLASNTPAFQWRYKPSNGGADVVGSSALVILLRLLNLHVIPGVDLTTLSGSGVAMSYGGEFVRYQNGSLFAAGNVDANTVAVSTASKTAKNGTAHYIDRILTYSTTTIGKHIEKLGGTDTTTSKFYYFWQYLKNMTGYNTGTGEILNVAAGTFYTVFIPNNDAILAAVNDGLLPGTGTIPNKPLFNPTSTADKDKVSRFIYYHMLNKKSVATDGMESGSFETLYKTNDGDPTYITVHNATPNAMTLTDNTKVRTANIILAPSNYLSNRCVIHLIDNYLKSE